VSSLSVIYCTERVVVVGGLGTGWGWWKRSEMMERRWMNRAGREGQGSDLIRNGLVSAPQRVY